LNPADCLDIVDDMYKTFYSLEVRNSNPALASNMTFQLRIPKFPTHTSVSLSS
jgi:hypothetical protein